MVFLERARVSAELAERAWRPADPLPGGTGVATACELFRQGLHWGLLAHRALTRESSDGSPSLTALWDETDPAVLARIAGSSERAAWLRAELVDRSYVDFAELAAGKQEELAGKARDALRTLLETFEPERRKLERAWFRRVLFTACGVVLLVALVLVGRTVAATIEARRDLAAGASFTTSSAYSEGGCPSPHQDCAESPNYFFHTTQENDPWVMIDLGTVKQTSSVVVRNRIDCCAERAVPLVVELSTDKKTWTVVGTQTTPFESFRASFARTRARYVKVHVAKPDGILHLKSVRVLP